MKCPKCNTTDQQPGGMYCHLCGTRLISQNATKDKGLWNTEVTPPSPGRRTKKKGRDDDDTRPATWTRAIRWILMVLLMAEAVFFSIQEQHLEPGWFCTAVMLVNVPAIFLALSLCIDINIHGNDAKTISWRLYYGWLHFPAAAIVIAAGYYIILNTQNFFTFFLVGALSGVLLILDTGDLD